MTVNPTTDGLLAALRRHTNRPDLAWATPPLALTGGFWAEMYVIELVAEAPAELQGRLAVPSRWRRGTSPTPRW